MKLINTIISLVIGFILGIVLYHNFFEIPKFIIYPHQDYIFLYCKIDEMSERWEPCTLDKYGILQVFKQNAQWVQFVRINSK